MLPFLRADRNDKHGCTLKRNKTDWLEILTPKHYLSQSDTFPACSNQVSSAVDSAKKAVIKCVIKRIIKLLLVKY